MIVCTAGKVGRVEDGREIVAGSKWLESLFGSVILGKLERYVALRVIIAVSRF